LHMAQLMPLPLTVSCFTRCGWFAAECRTDRILIDSGRPVLAAAAWRAAANAGSAVLSADVGS